MTTPEDDKRVLEIMEQIEKARIEAEAARVRECSAAFEWLVANRGLKLPHGVLPGHGPGRGFCLFSENSWAAYPWNPRTRYILSASPDHQTLAWADLSGTFGHIEEPDPDASEQPSWADISVALRETAIIDTRDQAERTIREASDEHRRRLTDEDTLETPVGTLHVGDGLDHMTGLLQIAENANEAGRHMPRVVMRHPAGGSDANVAVIQTQAKLRGMLERLADRENLVESAHNQIMRNFETFVWQRDNAALTLEQREHSAHQAQEIARNYGLHLDGWITHFRETRDDLPTDPDELREVYLERIEADALRLTTAIRDTVTRQGNALDPSCDDEAGATREVSRLRKLGAIALANAATADALKAAYDDAVAAMSKVRARNVPVWQDGSGKALGDALELEIAKPLSIRALHPADGIPGQVALGPLAAVDGFDLPEIKATPVIADDDAFRWLRVRVSPPEEGATAKADVFARNLCGLGRPLRLTVTRPSDDAVDPVP